MTKEPLFSLWYGRSWKWPHHWFEYLTNLPLITYYISMESLKAITTYLVRFSFLTVKSKLGITLRYNAFSEFYNIYLVVFLQLEYRKVRNDIRLFKINWVILPCYGFAYDKFRKKSYSYNRLILKKQSCQKKTEPPINFITKYRIQIP